MLSVECSVATGFEFAAKSEALSKLSLSAEGVTVKRGNICISLDDCSLIQDILRLRSIDNVVGVFHRYDDPLLVMSPKHTCLDSIVKKVVTDTPWQDGLTAWEAVYGTLPSGIHRSMSTLEHTAHRMAMYPPMPPQTIVLEGAPGFRVTCYRSGVQHSFTSPEVATVVGGELQERFHWRVALKSFDVEFVVCINETEVSVGVGLTRGSLHRRNLAMRGPTAMRATIAYCLVSLAEPQSGQFLCDPMCGSGSIAIEAAVGFPQLSAVFAGDIDARLVAKTATNISHNLSSAPVSVCQWDACHLPLLAGTLDAIVTDLPFGKRLGSKTDNRRLYPQLLAEWHRVLSDGGTAVLLTQDCRSMNQAVDVLRRRHGLQWTWLRQITVNIGGLTGWVFVLKKFVS